MPGPFDGAPATPAPRPPRVRVLARRQGPMLHGGTSHSREPVWRPQRLAAADAGARDALQREAGAGHALWLLRFARRGWNGDAPARSPTPAGRWTRSARRRRRARRARSATRWARRTAVPGRRRPQRARRGRPGPLVRRRRAGRRAAPARTCSRPRQRDRITSARGTAAYVERAAAVAAARRVHRHGRRRPLPAAPAAALEPLRAASSPSTCWRALSTRSDTVRSETELFHRGPTVVRL